MWANEPTTRDLEYILLTALIGVDRPVQSGARCCITDARQHMNTKKISPLFSVSSQISVTDFGTLASQGYRTIINNRPDAEADDQPNSYELAAAAQRQGLHFHAQPVESGKITDADVVAFASLLKTVEGPVLAFCRTGTRSMTLWSLSQAPQLSTRAILGSAAAAGYNLENLTERLERQRSRPGIGALPRSPRNSVHDVVIVGGGAGGLAAAASLLKRRPELDVVVVEPQEHHYYQPGWTLVGGGVFERSQTERTMASVMPNGVQWQHSAVAAFEPAQNAVILEDGEKIQYRALVVAPGIKLNWDAVDGLTETLGRNGVTSNYRFDLAPYTWELVQSLRGGRAVFTQPPMPIKCAGAPQKAMYLSCDHWLRQGRLNSINVDFCNAGAVLFGVPDYVPALEKYVEKYGVHLNFHHNLISVDGPAKTATFKVISDGQEDTTTVNFDMLHVCPPQSAPDFIQTSPLADSAGWLAVSPETLVHPDYGNVFGLGDACSAPNAKTAAAVRKQAPVVAENVLAILEGKAPRAVYDGYGSCPLTVERGKVVLAEFGYGGKLLPSLPSWLLDGTKATRAAWFVKVKLLPPIYFDLMLRGREWLAQPALLPGEPPPQEVASAGAEKPLPQTRKAS